MNNLVVALALFVVGSVAASEDIDGFLAPCTRMPHGSHIRSLVKRGVELEPLVTYTAMPSFDTEYGWALYEKSGAFILRSVKFRSSVWSDPGWTKPRPEGDTWIEGQMEVHERQVSPGFSIAISELVERELVKVRDRPVSDVFLEGVTYEFTEGGACGEARSPAISSRMQLLVEISEMLRSVASASSESGSEARQEAVASRIEDFSRLAPRK